MYVSLAIFLEQCWGHPLSSKAKSVYKKYEAKYCHCHIQVPFSDSCLAWFFDLQMSHDVVLSMFLSDSLLLGLWIICTLLPTNPQIFSCLLCNTKIWNLALRLIWSDFLALHVDLILLLAESSRCRRNRDGTSDGTDCIPPNQPWYTAHFLVELNAFNNIWSCANIVFQTTCWHVGNRCQRPWPTFPQPYPYQANNDVASLQVPRPLQTAVETVSSGNASRGSQE